MGKILCVGGFIIFYIVCFTLREGILKDDFIGIWDCSASFVSICVLYFFINRITFVSGILKFFGNYSTLIFLTHTFIRYYWFKDFVYGHISAWVNYIVLLVAALFTAVVLDLLLKLLQIRRVEDYVRSKIMSLTQQ